MRFGRKVLAVDKTKILLVFVLIFILIESFNLVEFVFYFGLLRSLYRFFRSNRSQLLFKHADPLFARLSTKSFCLRLGLVCRSILFGPEGVQLVFIAADRSLVLTVSCRARVF